MDDRKIGMRAGQRRHHRDRDHAVAAQPDRGGDGGDHRRNRLGHGGYRGVGLAMRHGDVADIHQVQSGERVEARRVTGR